jgi:hypothetical protein
MPEHAPLGVSSRQATASVGRRFWPPLPPGEISAVAGQKTGICKKKYNWWLFLRTENVIFAGEII